MAAAASPNYVRLFLILPTGRSDTKCFLPFGIIFKRIDCVDLLVCNAYCYQNVCFVFLLNENITVSVHHHRPVELFRC